MGHAGLVQSYFVLLYSFELEEEGKLGSRNIWTLSMFELEFLLMQEASFEYLVYEIGIIPVIFQF